MNIINPLIIARKSLYLSVSAIDRIQNISLRGPVIFCYHSFNNDDWLHGVSVENFEKQIRFLTSNYKQASISQIERVIKGEDLDLTNYFLITIDDGYKDVMNIRKIITKYNIKPILFLLADRKNLNRIEMDNNKKLLSDSEIKLLANDGWIIGSHGSTHSDFYKLSAEDQVYEIIESKKSIEKIINKKINFFAYPKGRYTNEIIRTVKKAKYTLGFSMDDGFINGKTDQFVIPRIGVNRSHSISEFKQMISPLVVKVRGYLKKNIKGLTI
jgi:peptidoglycan/xylan/chitin deacetylase (PgdA/CDA1 family)